MSRLLGAMKLKIREIVLLEKRPFTFADFRESEIAGQKYHMKDGTFRNFISKLRKSGEVELAFIKTCILFTFHSNGFCFDETTQLL
jgi:hypothetical protein